MALTITDGTGGHSVTFRHTPVVERTGWHRFCAPIGPLDANGNLPSNGQGTWVLPGGRPSSDWTAVITNVQSFRFAVDMGSPLQDEKYQLDNICFVPRPCARADFHAPSCARPPVTIQNTSVAATSSSWTFTGGAPATSTAANPTVSYGAPGSYPVKLCINGGTAAPLCITKNITIAPATPVITGPVTACQKPATYCVAAQPGVTFNWSVSPSGAGTIVPVSSTCIRVNWNGTSGGTVNVVAISKEGCRASSRLVVQGCPGDPCCPDPTFRIGTPTLTLVGSNWQFRPVISASSARRVEISIISASTVSTPAVVGCRSVPSFAPVITSVTPVVAGLAGSLPVPNATEATWSGPATSLNNVPFPLNVQLPALPSHCSDVVKICVKYTVTDANCRTCERIECYELPRGAIIEAGGSTTTAAD